MDKLKTRILLISLLLVLVFSLQGVSATTDGDANLTSENTDLSICDNEGDVSSDGLSTPYESNYRDEVLSANPSTYSQLASEIGSGGNIELQHDYYTFDYGSTISITSANSVIDGRGAVIDMEGSNIQVFNVNASNVTIKNLIIKNANYGGDGGAICFNSPGDVSNCNFMDNSARYGGAIYFKSSGNVTNCNFTDNTADIGGAVDIDEDGTLINCNFVNNKASNAGAIYIRNSGNVSNCNFTDNTVSYYGGAVWCNNNSEITNCNFNNNTADLNGGAILMYSGSVSNCNFTNGSASFGGAVYLTEGNVSNCNFAECSVSDCGGAVYLTEGNVSNCNFTDNSASYGGAVFIYELGVVENCNFNNNEVTGETSYGGAVAFWDYGNVTNCNFTNNKATGDYTYGGAMWVALEGTVANCNFVNNKATGESYGGAIIIFKGTVVTYCNFVNNSAEYHGGAIDSDVICNVSNCNFTGNTAFSGSAIYFERNLNNYSLPDTDYVFNSSFLNNRANAKGFQVTKNKNGIEITFTGRDNLLNGIYAEEVDVSITNVTYWGAEGIANTGSSPIIPSKSNKESGQNITVDGVVNGNILSTTKVTDSEGKIVLDDVNGVYNITVRHDLDSYYTEAEKIIVNKVNTEISSAEDITGKAGEKTDITVEIVDENGNPVKNGTATLTVDGKTYTADVVDGVATFKDVVLPEKDTVADVYYQGNDYYNSSSATFSIKIKHDSTDGNKTKHTSSNADVNETGNPIVIMLLALFSLVITYRKK